MPYVYTHENAEKKTYVSLDPEKRFKKSVGTKKYIEYKNKIISDLQFEILQIKGVIMFHNGLITIERISPRE
jgi:hypothetical protein